MSKKLFVGNLKAEATDLELSRLFAAHGTVLSAQVAVNRQNGGCQGFGFVEMKNRQEAQAAVDALHGRDVDNRPLTVLLEPVIGSWGTCPTTMADRLVHIRILGQRIDGYIQFMSAAETWKGASAEAKNRAVIAFHARLQALERELGRIQEELRLG